MKIVLLLGNLFHTKEHSLSKGKYHCTGECLFDLFGFDQTSKSVANMSNISKAAESKQSKGILFKWLDSNLRPVMLEATPSWLCYHPLPWIARILMKYAEYAFSSWSRSYKDFFSLNLCFALFKQSDWLNNFNSQSECLKLREV